MVACGGVAARVPAGKRHGDAIGSNRNSGGGGGGGDGRDARAHGGRRRRRARGGGDNGDVGNDWAGCEDEASTFLPLPLPSGEYHRETRGVRGCDGGGFRGVRVVDVDGVASGGVCRAGIVGTHTMVVGASWWVAAIAAGTVVTASVADDRCARRARERLAKAA